MDLLLPPGHRGCGPQHPPLPGAPEAGPPSRRAAARLQRVQFTIGPATYALGLFIASGVFDAGPALRRSGTSACLGSARRTPSRSRSTTAPACEGYGPPVSAGGEAGEHTLSS